MKQEAIWLIAGGPMQRVAAKRIKDRGLALILSDGSEQAACRELADYFLAIDTFDVDAHLAVSEQVRYRFHLRGIMTAAADCHYTVNRLAQHLGLHHLAPSISETCRNKIKTRQALNKAGVPQPRFFLAGSYEEAVTAASRIHGDYVVKATDNSGSRGFSALSRGQTLSYEQFCYAVETGTTGYAIIEERLIADDDQVSEASVETLWQDGSMYWINWVDRIFPRDFKFFPGIAIDRTLKESIEIGHINPALRSKRMKDEVHSMMVAAGVAIGLKDQPGAHILKGDIFFSNRGPVILELTPRISGGWDSSGSSVERGAEIADGVIHISMGKPVDLDGWQRYFGYKYPELRSVVVSEIPEDAMDCLGRKFAHHSGHGSIDSILSKALTKLRQRDFYVPPL